jgi:hypothetical protein
LLLENDKSLVETGVATFDLLAKNVNLSVLAAEAEHGRSGNVRIVQISGDQPAEIVRVLARAAATAFMQKEPDAINVGEDAGRREVAVFLHSLGLWRFAFAMCFD